MLRAAVVGVLEERSILKTAGGSNVLPTIKRQTGLLC